MSKFRPLFTRSFWLDAAERATKTAAQGALLGLGASDTGPFNLFSASPLTVLGFAAGGALLSVLTSAASAPVSGMSPASIVPPGA